MSTPLTPDADYRGPDRRIRPCAMRRACWLWAVAVLLAPVVGLATSPRDTRAVTVAATIALTLAVLVGLLAGLSSRTLGDHRMMTFALGLITLVAGPVLVAAFLGRISLPDGAVPNADLAALPALVLLGLAPFGPPIDTRHHLRRTLGVGAASTLLAVALALPWLPELVDWPNNDGLRHSVPALLALAGLAVALTVSYVVHGLRASSNVLLAFGLVPLAGAVAAVVAAADGPRAIYVAWFTLSVGMLGALHMIVGSVLWAHRTERRRVLAALSHVEVLRAHEDASKLSRAHVHELRSGLLMLESAMQRLVERPGTDSELARAVAAEISRLRVLLDPSRNAALDGHYALADALSPVLTCARASGMKLLSHLDDDLVVDGDPLVTAQVLHGLLANADRHAHGSPVEVACEREGSEVVVRVADHGPGLVETIRDHVFEAGVRDQAGGGDGLGLSIASRLVASQHGRIRVLERGDGLTFELRLPATAGL